jgi:hypothetical protein
MIMARREKLERPTLVDLKPSQVTDEYWLHAHRRKNRPYPTSINSGKWLIFVPASQVDEVWARIKDTTEQGLLGGSAKVATARPNRLAKNPNMKVICVYTYDWTDVEDVRRVRQQLREMGFTAKIPYKSDEDTLAGNYATQGGQRVSKYYE